MKVLFRVDIEDLTFTSLVDLAKALHADVNREYFGSAEGALMCLHVVLMHFFRHPSEYGMRDDAETLSQIAALVAWVAELAPEEERPGRQPVRTDPFASLDSVAGVIARTTKEIW